jgi:hypothetical protein
MSGQQAASEWSCDGLRRAAAGRQCGSAGVQQRSASGSRARDAQRAFDADVPLMQPAFDTSGMASTPHNSMLACGTCGGPQPAVHGPSPWPRRSGPPPPPLAPRPPGQPAIAARSSSGGRWPTPSDYEHGPPAAAAEPHPTTCGNRPCAPASEHTCAGARSSAPAGSASTSAAAPPAAPPWCRTRRRCWRCSGPLLLPPPTWLGPLHHSSTGTVRAIAALSWPSLRRAPAAPLAARQPHGKDAICQRLSCRSTPAGAGRRGKNTAAARAAASPPTRRAAPRLCGRGRARRRLLPILLDTSAEAAQTCSPALYDA